MIFAKQIENLFSALARSLSPSKTLNLYLVRHGETEANVDRTLYTTKADHAIRLTSKGISQAEKAGDFLGEMLLEQEERHPLNFGNIRVWHSPYYRARETAYHILGPLAERFNPESGTLSYREDPFLFEQKAGLFDGLSDGEFAHHYPNEAADYAKHSKFNGRAYARTPLGDSRIDIVIRVKHFFGTILDDLYKHDIRHVIVINHGVTVRAMTMGWMRYAPEWLDAEQNPGNCWIRHIHGTRRQGYVDAGYIHGEGATIGNMMATQRQLTGAEDIYLLKPGRPNGIVPLGVTANDPFLRSDKKQYLTLAK